MLSRVYCAATIGVNARLIEVEVNISGGLPKYFLVGLPDRAVSEARDRIEAALKNAGTGFPLGRITVNLAPADIPKEGSSFDLPIALGLLEVSGKIVQGRLKKTLALGELALDGQLRPVKGVLPIAMEAQKRGIKNLITPLENAAEAAVVEGLCVYGFRNLNEVTGWIRDPKDIRPVKVDINALFSRRDTLDILDFSDVRGQENVKRALEVAAAGGHNVIMVGPQGSGKTMMARRIPGILPPLSTGESLETTKIHSVAGLLPKGNALVTTRPFRSPHHTVSDVALVGGGSMPRPGEMSMAHNGVLFLDELPEFRRSALEVMRQPLEDGFVSISRARMSVRYPSSVMLVASMNPSPSGGWYDPSNPEADTPVQMQKYLGKISGPLLDRIDLHIEVEKVNFEELSRRGCGESSVKIRERVIRARNIQLERFSRNPEHHCNARMTTKMVRSHCVLDQESRSLMKNAMSVLGFTARAYNRILKVSRTIADLEGVGNIRSHHVAEAIQYRSLDRKEWQG